MANDFKVIPHIRKGKELWAVVAGKNSIVSVSADKSQSDSIAENLNKDAWFLDRGYTRADRCASW